jgi:hypothetical protein
MGLGHEKLERFLLRDIFFAFRLSRSNPSELSGKIERTLLAIGLNT